MNRISIGMVSKVSQSVLCPGKQGKRMFQGEGMRNGVGVPLMGQMIELVGGQRGRKSAPSY